MSLRFHFTLESDWRWAPLAFWVHLPVASSPGRYAPEAPVPVLHNGFMCLHVDAAGVDLRFSSLAQLDHFIAVMGSTPLPTSRQLSGRRDVHAGPNGHWLSRLPAKLKSPGKRAGLVIGLRKVRDELAPLGNAWHSLSQRP